MTAAKTRKAENVCYCNHLRDRHIGPQLLDCLDCQDCRGFRQWDDWHEEQAAIRRLEESWL